MSILNSIPKIAEFFAGDETDAGPWCSGLHSGNIGDIIYSLPTCRMLEINHMILNLCVDPGFGGRVLNERTARALAPLLLAQKFIRRVTIIKSNVPWEFANPADLGVDYILDSFRASFTNPRLHLLYAHSVPFNLMVDGSQAWVTIEREPGVVPVKQEHYIVVGLTNRYRRFDHAYYEHLFRDVPAERVFFVGIENDQVERRNIGGTAFQAANFVDLAKLLANASLFIGNPSFTYALAEGIKVNRFVEVPEDNNVYPLDGSGSLLHMYEPEYVRSKMFEALQLPAEASHCYRALTCRITQLEATVASIKEQEQSLRAEADAAREQILRAEADASREQILRAEAHAREQILRAEAHAEAARRKAIEESTIWKASYPARLLLRHLPSSARRFGRKVIRGVWRVSTLQLLRRPNPSSGFR